MTKLYLMRHGETLFNTQKRIQGWCDSPLTKAGITQAQKARAYLERASIRFDALYCSTAERTADTLELATGRKDYRRIKGLKEFFFGKFEGQPEYLHPTSNAAGHFGDYYVQHGGESQTGFAQRIKKTVTELAQAHPHQSILAVSHAGVLMTFFHEIVKYEQLPPPPGNCAIMVFNYDERGFQFEKIIDPLTEEIHS